MAGKRFYDDGCAVAHALDLIGERWGLLVVRELMLQPKRFTDLRAALPGISPNVLTQRLQQLEATAVVVRRKLPPPAGVWVYDLTDWGRELEPAFRVIGRWAARSPSLQPGKRMSAASLVLSFRTMFDRERAFGLTARVGLRLGEETFVATIGGGRLEIAPGAPGAPGAADGADALITAEPTALAAIVYGGHAVAEALAEGSVKVEGDAAAARRFTTLFPLPERAPKAR